MEKEIIWVPTTNGPDFCIDAEDAPKVLERTWYVSKKKTDNTWYVFSLGEKVSLHRMIMDAPVGLVVDHKDGDGLNNTKANMRVITNGQNLKNRRKTFIVGSREVSSQYKGVMRGHASWRATIWYGGKSVGLGSYYSEIEAAVVYDEASRREHGEFGRVNFPEGPPPFTRQGKVTQSIAGYAREAKAREKRQAA